MHQVYINIIWSNFVVINYNNILLCNNYAIVYTTHKLEKTNACKNSYFKISIDKQVM